MDLRNIIRAPILERLSFSHISILGPVILVSALAVYFVGDRLRQVVVAIQAASMSQSAQKAAQATVERKPLPPAEMQRYVEMLGRLHPTITFELAPDAKAFTVSIGDPKLYNDWLYALYSLQSHGKNVLWDVSKLCLRSCGSGAAIAVVHGYTQSIRFK